MTTRIELIFPDLDETLAANVTDVIATALAGDEVLNLLMAHASMHRTFEVKLIDPALPSIDGQTYEVTNGTPGEVRVTDLGGNTGGNT